MTVTCTYDYSGLAETWTVPEGVTRARVSVAGAQGAVLFGFPEHGQGARVDATLPGLVPGATYEIRVGGSGHLDRGLDPSYQSAPFNGGGHDPELGMDGGGASDIRPPGGDLSTRLVVAGGGGGAGFADGLRPVQDEDYVWTRGGVGGSSAAPGGGGEGFQDISGGPDRLGGSGGAPGGASTGGAGGAAASTGFEPIPPAAGSPGTFGVGGSPAPQGTVVSDIDGETYPAARAVGGAGGGGWWGGGAGGSGLPPSGPRGGDPIECGIRNPTCIGTGGGGGGGGSSHVAPSLGAIDAQVLEGNREGHGEIVISWLDAAPVATVALATGQAARTNDPTLRWTVSFSEPISGLATDDLLVTGTAVRGPAMLTGSGTTYGVTVPVTGDGTVALGIRQGAVTDQVLLPNTAPDPVTVTYDTTAPQVTMSLAPGQTASTTSPTATFRAVFTEAVTGFSAADVSLAGSTAPGASVSSVAEIGSTGNVYEITATTTGPGTIVVTVPAGRADDLAGNPNTAAPAAAPTVTRTAVETGPVTVTIDQSGGDLDPTPLDSVRFIVRFSRAVTGFEASDVVLGGSGVTAATRTTVASFGADLSTYRVTVEPLQAPGNVSATVPAGAASALSDGTLSATSTSTDNTVTLVVPSGGPGGSGEPVDPVEPEPAASDLDFAPIEPTSGGRALVWLLEISDRISIDPDRVVVELVDNTFFDRVRILAGLPGGLPRRPADDDVVTGTAFRIEVEGLRGPPGEVRVRLPRGSITRVSDGATYPEVATPPIRFAGSDLVAPETVMVGGPLEGVFLSSGTVSFELGSDDPAATFLCSVDAVPAPCDSGVLGVELPPGEHELVVAAVDEAGNIDQTPETRRVVVPRDDRSLRVGGGFVPRVGQLAYDGTYAVARQHGATLVTELADVRQVAVVATTGPDRGRVRVVLGSQRLGVLDLERPVRTERDVLVLPPLAIPLSGTLRLVTVGREPVRIDGIGVRTGLDTDVPSG